MMKKNLFKLIILVIITCGLYNCVFIQSGSEIGNPLSPPDSTKKDTVETKGEIIFIEKK